MEHTLYTHHNCPYDHREMEHCPICDAGIRLCKVCGEFEAGLDNPCKPKKEDHYAIVGHFTGVQIGCCTSAGVEDVRLEEPQAKIIPMPKSECKVCNKP